jgi:hypothetical protein
MALPGNGREDGAPVGPDGGDAFEAEQQLTLADADERLPWLESEDDYEQPGVDTGRIVAFAAIGLLAIVVALGAVWLFTREPAAETAVADGSTIEAPDGPYKTRPAEPGGREVEGTGDTSFEVAEGEAVVGRIAGSGEAPEPSIDREQAGVPAQAGAVGVQVGAYSNRAQAEAGWSQLAGRFEALQGRNHRVLEGTADSGTIYRLQALAGTVTEAETLCRSIKAAGGDCQVKR